MPLVDDEKSREVETLGWPWRPMVESGGRRGLGGEQATARMDEA